MKMVVKITFDPMDVAPKAIKEAVIAAGVKAENISLHSQREAAEATPKKATKPEAVRS
jgi:hypothetical protein